MIDACKNRIFYDTEEEMHKVLTKSLFTFRKRKISKYTGEPIDYFDMLNQSVKSYPLTKKIDIENSLHKLRHENNYCDFPLSQITETCKFLSDTFEKNTDKMRVIKFEFSLTVETPDEPMYYLNRFTHFRLKRFYDVPPPHNHSLPLERFCPFTQYLIKFYDTAQWHGLKGKNYLKGEICTKKMNKIYDLTGRHPYRSPITVSDYTHKPFLDAMANFYLDTYRNIEKFPFIDCRVFKPHTRDFLFAGCNPLYWEEEKRINANTAKKKRSRYLQLRKEISQTGDEPFKELETLFQSKYEYLINN